MDKSDLEACIGILTGVLEANNWSGRFTKEVRELTMPHRLENTARPVADVLVMLRAELDKRNRLAKPIGVRGISLPYKDD